MPDWNELIGKTVLLGLTFTDADGQLREQTQRHGVIEVADDEQGVGIRLVAPGQPWDRELYWVPPDLNAFAEAAPGSYKLRATGETVVDPDFTSTWEIRSPSEEEDTPERRAAREEEARRYGFPL
jgi:hypothetical protein